MHSWDSLGSPLGGCLAGLGKAQPPPETCPPEICHEGNGDMVPSTRWKAGSQHEETQKGDGPPGHPAQHPQPRNGYMKPGPHWLPEKSPCSSLLQS